jgi:hypothetical protein
MKTLNLKMYNTINDKEVISFQMPIDPYKCANGFYTRYFNNTKDNIASHQKVNKRHIKIVFSVSKVKTDRWFMKFANGFTANLPYDITNDEINIVLAQVNVLKMPFDLKESEIVKNHKLKNRINKKLKHLM